MADWLIGLRQPISCGDHSTNQMIRSIILWLTFSNLPFLFQVASAALDVYSAEPPPESARELLAHPRLVCTPHLGASTEEAQVGEQG